MTTRIVALILGICLATVSRVEAQDAAKTKLAAEALAILKSTCHRCHGDNGTVEGGLTSFVLDRQRLVSQNQIVPGDSAGSKLIRRIQSHEMPPAGEQPELTQQQIDALVKWVDADAPDFSKAQPARKFITPATMIGAMLSDLKKQPAANRKFTRYFTLTHLYNSGRSDDELRSYFHGVSKLVNSLSWGRNVKVPTLIGTPPTILRIDIRDYKWTAAVWDKLADADPYGIVYPAVADAKQLYTDAGCPLPYVRADWFVGAASRPPLYHEILQLPETAGELETLLHVNVEEDIRSSQVARAGFNSSAVSRNNRMIERHESSYGYYWKTYDFARNVDRQNVFSHPLGPGKDTKEFRHDGGEMIFSLPNGFQAYLMVDAKGKRIDKGPTEIVSDPKQPDRAVENGFSCMSCHIHGTLAKEDQIRAHVEKNPGAFSKKEVEAILALYPPREKFQELLDDDASKFRKAYEAAGLPQAFSEPIAALATIFESELDLPLAAAEAGMKPDEFKTFLSKSPAIARELGSLQTEGGTAQRETFAGSFPAVVKTAKLGTFWAKSVTAKTAVAKSGTTTTKKNATETSSKGKRPTKGTFKSKIVELTDKAAPSWFFREARVGTQLLADREYSIAALPKEMVGGTLFLHDTGVAGWLPAGAIKALKPCTVYAIVRWKEHGKIEIDEGTFAKFAKEDWEEVDGEFKSNVDGPFDVRYKTLRKKVEAGDIMLQLDTIDFGRRAAYFVFKLDKDSGQAASSAGKGAKSGAGKDAPPKGFQSTVVEFTDKASPNWIFKEAKAGTLIEPGKGYALAKLPEEMEGGSFLLRDSGGWLPDGVVNALEDCKAYMIVRYKYLGKVVIDDGTFAQLERDGWEDAGEVKTTFPNGEDWRWKALSKDVSEGEVFLTSGTANLANQAVLFMFK